MSDCSDAFDYMMWHIFNNRLMPVKQGGICETGESINQNGLSMVWPQAP